jgi:hypothetical protein
MRCPEELSAILEGIVKERERQDKKFGVHDHPNGTGEKYAHEREYWKGVCDHNFRNGKPAWSLILLEEVYEALSEEDPDKLYDELIQVASVCAAWCASISRVQGPEREASSEELKTEKVKKLHYKI